jgi:murein DD-endopeptidase MepM/ murein hydrolase activator NlpD
MTSPDDSTGRPHKRTLALLLLLALNAGTGHILTSQIISRVNAQGVSLIKDDQVSALEADTLSEGSPIAPITEESNSAAENHEITTYTVQNGDTIGEIAEQYGISVDTVRWANDLGSKGTIKAGDKITMLPISGVLYTVQKGDTLSGIADKYDAHSQEILTYNGLADAKSIKPGMKLIIPGGEMVPEPVKKMATKTVEKTTSKKTDTSDKKTSSSTSTVSSGKFIMPIPGSIITQGKHDSTAVDFGAPVGTSVKAAASGNVSLVNSGGYGGGYGTYIIISHSDGTQTLYAHLSSAAVAVGDSVSQGEVIGKSGNTGRSTGPHLHFEVRGGSNPFFNYKVGTRF